MDTADRTSPILMDKVRRPEPAGIARPHLEARLGACWDHRLTLLTAPAGYGKTTVLSQLAARTDAPVAWLTVEGSDGRDETLLPHLEAALAAILERSSGGWTTVDEAIADLERWPGTRALLVIDDLHTLQGTSSERALERLVRRGPPYLAVAAAARETPDWNLSRMRAAGTLLHLNGEDLRFRSWEVERLFRDHYREPLPPTDLALLTRRTAGWAAALHLFHLAGRGKSVPERRRILDDLGHRHALVRDYLARNVLAELPARLRSFLLDTCTMGPLSPRLCDELLARDGSAEALRELRRRELLSPSPTGRGGRIPPLLRAHLQAELADRIGRAELRRRYARAGRLLAADGAVADALRAYCRAEDWQAARRLLSENGEAVVDDPAAVMALPAAIADRDPWVLLARARRAVAGGRVQVALDLYEAAETAFGRSAMARRCRRERSALAPWAEPLAGAASDPSALVRAATRSDPRTATGAALQLDRPGGRLAAGLTALLAGHVRQARRLLRAETAAPDTGPVAVAAARIGVALAELLAGEDPDIGTLEATVAGLGRTGQPWLARLGQSVASIARGGPGAVDEICRRSRLSPETEDPWGEILHPILAGLAALVHEEPTPQAALSQAIERARGLEATVLEAWATAIRALLAACEDHPERERLSREAERSSRRSGADGPRLLAALARSCARASRSCGGSNDHDRDREEAAQLSRASGMSVERWLRSPCCAPAPQPPPGETELRLLGGFRLVVRGREVDLTEVKPQAREVLYRLAVEAGRGVHEQAIIADLWPDADADRGRRRLQVAVSALRGLLARDDDDTEWIRRHHEAYLLHLDGGTSDLRRFEELIESGHQARAAGDLEAAIPAYAEALAVHQAELLPELGPTEWVVALRRHYRDVAVRVAAALARLLLATDRPAAAAQVSQAGLEIDRYADELWQLRMDAHERAGHRIAAERTREAYREMLEELGV